MVDLRHAHERSTPMRGCLLSVLEGTRLGTHLSRVPKRVPKACFSLSHRHFLAGPASQPPAPNKLSTGGWEVKKWRWDRKKQETRKAKSKTDRTHGTQGVEVEVVVQITRRDDEMLEWLGTVRMADMEAIQWALGALNGFGGPAGRRVAQRWVSRMVDLGLANRERLTYQEGQVVWATHAAVGRTAPNLYRQTTRHELAVAAVSARYLARGYEWFRDRRPMSLQDHQVDGVAVKGDVVELIEVELTAKKLARYKLIHNHHGQRMATGGVSRVVYLCTKDAARVVAKEADRFIFRDQRHRLVALPVFDVKGRWIGNDTALWEGAPEPVSNAGEIPTPHLWEREEVSS